MLRVRDIAGPGSNMYRRYFSQNEQFDSSQARGQASLIDRFALRCGQNNLRL